MDDRATPRPWRVATSGRRPFDGVIETVEEYQFYWKNGRPRGKPDRLGIAFGVVPNPADLDLIVRAVNAHADLVAACEEAMTKIARLTPLVDSGDSLYGEIADDCDRVRERLRAALAKATAASP